MLNKRNEKKKESDPANSFHEMTNNELMEYFREQLQIQAQVIEQLRNRIDDQDKEIRGLREQISYLKEYFDSKL